MDHKTAQEFKKLSKEAFGTTSRWQKLVNKGVQEPMQREREVVVPDRRGGVTTKIFVEKKLVIKRYSLEEVKKLMEDIIAIKKGLTPAPTPAHSTPSVQALDESNMPPGMTVTGTGIPDGTVVVSKETYDALKKESQT